MKIIKIGLLITLFIVIAGAGVYVYANRTGQNIADLLPKQIQNILPDNLKIDQEIINNNSQIAGEQLQEINKKAQTVKEHIGKVLGESTASSDSAKQIHQKAFEYGRYIYCQEVIKEYESQN